MVTDDTNEFGNEKFILKEYSRRNSVSKRIIISGENLIDAQPRYDNFNNQPIVSFSLDRLVLKDLVKLLLKILEKE